jgi:glutamine amidotransferase
MQLLFDASEEDDARCLGIMRGTARRFESGADHPVPHMGWNQLRRRADVPLLKGIADDSYCYFVHSYALPVSYTTLATTSYGWEFTAIAGQGNFLATQFHPERSGTVGSTLLRNFLSCY